MKKIIWALALCFPLLVTSSLLAERDGVPGGYIPPGGDRADCQGLNGGLVAGPPDPGSPGPFDVGEVEYQLSLDGFEASDYVDVEEGVPIEEKAVVFYPRPLACGPFPVILIMHGGHGTCYSKAGDFRQEWLCTDANPVVAPLPFPNYRGYDYLGQTLASQGFVVVSISANGINATSRPDVNEARGELFQHHLDILAQMNTTNGPALGGLLKGKLNLNRVGTIGHSRGGEGAVRHAQINADQGSPYGLGAILLVSATQSSVQVVNGIPLAVLLPYCDGDQSGLPSTAYYDGARYNVAGDLAPKYSFELMGANHNYFNTNWDNNTTWFPPMLDASGPPPGSKDDALGPIDEDPVCTEGTFFWPRLTSVQQRAALTTLASAFFRVYLRGEYSFRKYLKGDVPPPPSAMTDKIFNAYHPPDDPEQRLDINRLVDPSSDTINTLGGDVSKSLSLDSELCLPDDPGATQGCVYPLPGGIYIDGRMPHAFNSYHTAGQMRLAWDFSRETQWWENLIPEADADFSKYSHIQLRALVDFFDERNPFAVEQDFSIELEDGAGLTARVPASGHTRSLFYPPGSPPANMLDDPVPRAILNTVRIPLAAFDEIFLTDIESVRLVFDRTFSGAINVADLALADPAANLSPQVSCSVTKDTLTPNGMLTDVGLNVTVDDPDFSGISAIDIDVFSDQDDTQQGTETDAILAPPDSLQLRAERDQSLGGRVYLISSRAVDNGGAQGFSCCAVTVPQGDATTADRAASALQNCTSFVAAGAGLLPPHSGYYFVGE